MAEALKIFFSEALVRRLANEISRVERSFPSRAFIKHVSAGLETLELLERGRHIADALAKHLPSDYPAALDVLLPNVSSGYSSCSRTTRRRSCAAVWQTT